MKTSMIVALIGVVGVIAFAGTVVAAGASTGFGDSSAGGMGGAHTGMHQSQYGQSASGCPMGHDYDYDNNYSWNYGGCGNVCPRT